MDKEIIEKYRKAGRIAAEAREYAKTLVKKGASILEICEKVDEKIISLGANPAFPTQISMNDVAAHFCPEKEDKTLLNDELVNIDIGVHVDGYIGDCAFSVDLSGKNEEIVKASEMALKSASELLKQGMKLKDIGREIERVIESFGFVPVKNLSGHGLDEYTVHTVPTIPNFNNHDEAELEKGMVFAIEPFATNGSGIVEERGNPSVFAVKEIKPTRIDFVRKILKQLESYNGLPFTKRWLKFPEAQINFAFKQFENMGILHKYPPLAEVNKGLVSQAEDTFFIDDDGKVECLTKL